MNRQRTTAYHPAANGMVERFHRQLKAALKCHPQPTHWMDTLPMVLLGVRTALKEDLYCTAAEMVYGTTLRLPGDFFVPTPASSTLDDPTNYAVRLKATMQQLHPPKVRSTSRHPIFINKDLDSSSHVFIRRDAKRTPLQPTYDGPFKVIDRSDKHFVIELSNKRKDTVSVDRLKPAYLDTSGTQLDAAPLSPTPSLLTTPTPATVDSRPPRFTSSGRRVKWRDRLDL